MVPRLVTALWGSVFPAVPAGEDPAFARLADFPSAADFEAVG
jgi:hypothetical protein